MKDPRLTPVHTDPSPDPSAAESTASQASGAADGDRRPGADPSQDTRPADKDPSQDTRPADNDPSQDTGPADKDQTKQTSPEKESAGVTGTLVKALSPDTLRAVSFDTFLPSKRLRSPRYSRFVSLAKVVFPSVAVVLVAVVAIWPQLEKVGTDTFAIGISSIGKRGKEMERLVNARFYGTDSDNQAYSVTADLAEETAPGSRIVRLDHPQADITLQDGAWVMMTAQDGLFHQQSNLLELHDGVSIFHDAGYEIHTDQATVDLPEGTAHGESEVHGQGPFGTLESEGFRVNRARQTIEFTGKAHLILRDSETGGPAAPVAGPASSGHTAGQTDTSSQGKH